MERVRFTVHELKIINSMAAIASAAAWGEGDYSNWSDKDSRSFTTLRQKVYALLERHETAGRSDDDILTAEMRRADGR